MSQSRYVFLEDVTIKKVTDKAILIDWNEEDVWIPLSQIASDDRDGLNEGTGYSFGITTWIAEQKGIEVE